MNKVSLKHWSENGDGELASLGKDLEKGQPERLLVLRWSLGIDVLTIGNYQLPLHFQFLNQ